MSLKNKSIKISVKFTPTHLDEMQLKDKNVVVIDVLRASSTIATALNNGAKEIIPVSSIENAVKISGNLFGDVTLRAGERNSRIIEGFNLGNSPLEYTEEVVKGKSIIYLSTNGSVAILKGKHARNLVVAGFVNLSSVVNYLAKIRDDFTIICAGMEEKFCLEDAVCAGRIINKLQSTIDDELILDDSSMACSILDKDFGKSTLKMLKSSDHGKYLIEIGFAEDLKFCAAVDIVNVLPLLFGNVIRLQK